MRLHRFFIETPISNSKVNISDERLLHQWRSVFRYNIGSEVLLFNGDGFEYDALIERLGNREASLSIVCKKKGIVPKTQINLFQSLIKKDKMEWVIEKTTELGISRIIPIISERSEKKGLNLERARKIALEASEQCGRVDVPEISEVLSLAEAIEKAQNVIVFDTGPHSSLAMLDFAGKERENQTKSISIFIGPEGGWSEKELGLFKQKGAEISSLGPLTLRAETAAIAVAARLLQ